MTIHPHQNIDITPCSALENYDELLTSLDISKSKKVSSPSGREVSLNAFLENIPRPTIKTEFPRSQQRIERTNQLVYCITLLLPDASSLSSPDHNQPLNEAEATWLAEVKNDPMEQHRLQWIATRMVQAFIQDAVKDSTTIAEIVSLGPILEKEHFRKLLSSLIMEFDESRLLDVDLLQGLVQLVQSSSPGYLLSDDLVKTLGMLRIRLQVTHQQSSEHPYHLTLAISRVLDVMADHNVQDLDRVLEHEPLSEVLSGLKGSSDPYLMYQACYAFQALQYVPNDETVLQVVLRHSRGVIDGAVKITALGQLDLGSVLEGLDSLQESLGSVMLVAGTVYEGVSSLTESGQGVLESFKQEFGSGKKQSWYAAIRVAYAFVQAGQLMDLNRLICEAPCRRDPLFQWGICQLLGEIAVDSLLPVASRQQAIVLLGRLYKEDPHWGKDESVKTWMLTIIDKLGSSTDQGVAAIALTLLQELTVDQTPKTHHPYPLRPRLSTPATSPILAKVQDIPYLEYELYKLRLQRLQEYNERAVYVPPQAKPSFRSKDDEHFPLQEKVQEFLASNRQVVLILGDSGSGKSTFNRHLEHLLWTEYKRGGPIPLFINLAAIDDPEHDMVTKQLQFHNFQEDQIMELKLHRQLVLICDGYDESQQLINLHKTNFLNQPGQWNTKMVISCRSQYLGHSYQDRFRPQSTNIYESVPHSVFEEAVIAPFSKEQIQDYVEKYVPLEPRAWSTQDYMDKLTTIPNLMDLVRNPFLLLLALEALPDVIKGKQDLSAIRIVRVQLFDTFVDHWLNVNKKRLLSNTLTREDHDMLEQLEEAGFVAMGVDYSMSLASAMFENQNGKAVVQYIQLKDKTTWKVEFFGPDPKVRLLREASPLTRSGSHHQFLHRSMLEYFFSRTVVGPRPPEHENEFTPQPSSDSSDIHSFDPECPLFTRNLLEEPSVMQFLSERVQENLSFKDRLLDIVEKSKTDASVALAAANAMTILVRAGVAFHRRDLRGVRIPGADLSGGQFDSALFQGADVTNANLGMCWMRNADFSNAHMDSVRFGELPAVADDDIIWTCACSPDGKTLVVGMRNGGISLYDSNTWEKIHWLEGHDHDTEALAFSPDSQRLASGGQDRKVQVWSCTEDEPLLTMEGHTDDVVSVAFSPCGNFFASASLDKTVRLWNSVTGEALFLLEGHTDSVNSVQFTSDGRRLISGSDDETIRFWDFETGASGDVWEPGSGTVECLDVSQDGQLVASGHGSGLLRLWNTVSGLPGPVLRGHTNCVQSVVFSMDGCLLASVSSDSTIRLWNSSAGSLASMFSSGGPVYGVSFLSNNQRLASIDGSNIIRLWDARSSGSSIEQYGHSDSVWAVAYLPTGQSILSASEDGTIRQWDVLTGAAGSIHSLAVYLNSIALSPDLNQAATGCHDSTIRLWDTNTEKRQLILEGHTDQVLGLTYSPCGRWIASFSDDRTVRLWDLHNDGKGHMLCEMTVGSNADPDTESDAESDAESENETDAESDAESEDETDAESEDEYYDDDDPFSLAFSPTGSQLAVGDKKATVSVYDTCTKELLTSTTVEGERVSALAYSPNGQELVFGINGPIYFWDLMSKDPNHKLQVETYGYSCFVYSSCERWIACGDEDSRVRLCRRQSGDIGTWDLVFLLKGSRDIVRSIAWNPVVPLEFVTGCQDRSVRVWRISESSDGCGAVSVDLMWASNIGMLSASGMTLDGVIGLDVDNRKIMKQRGAVGDVLTFEGDGAGDSPNDDGDSGDEEGPKGGPSNGSMLEEEKEEKDEEEYESEKRA